jgi:hypothetical protein
MPKPIDDQLPEQSIIALKGPTADKEAVGDGNDCPDERENQEGKQAHSQHHSTSFRTRGDQDGLREERGPELGQTNKANSGRKIRSAIDSLRP